MSVWRTFCFQTSASKTPCKIALKEVEETSLSLKVRHEAIINLQPSKRNRRRELPLSRVRGRLFFFFFSLLKRTRRRKRESAERECFQHSLPLTDFSCVCRQSNWKLYKLPQGARVLTRTHARNTTTDHPLFIFITCLEPKRLVG